MNLTHKDFLDLVEMLPELTAKKYYKVKGIGARNNQAVAGLVHMADYITTTELWEAAKPKVIEYLNITQEAKILMWEQSLKLVEANPQVERFLGLEKSELIWDATEIHDPKIEDISYNGYLEIIKKVEQLELSNYYKIQNICVARNEAVKSLKGASMLLTEELWPKKKDQVIRQISIIHQSAIELTGVLKEINENILYPGLVLENYENKQ